MLNRKTTALVVIDLQGKLARIVQDSARVIDNTVRLIRGAKLLGLPIIWIEQNPTGLGSTVPEIVRLFDEMPLSKTTFSCCGSEKISEAFDQLERTQLLVCGIESHVCVYQSVASLLQRQFEVELVTDAISSRTVHNRELGITKMRELGAGITSTEMCLFELVQDAEAPEFRDMLELVR